jgi:hypothetical protein
VPAEEEQGQVDVREVEETHRLQHREVVGMAGTCEEQHGPADEYCPERNGHDGIDDSGVSHGDQHQGRGDGHQGITEDLPCHRV